MARYPGATFVNQVSNRILPLTVWNRVNLHVTAGRGENAYDEPSHFYVRYSGEVKQYFDTVHQGQADLDGNDATISIETEGVEGEKWTPAQVASIIKLVAWCIVTHDIARKLATNSKVGTSSHGLSWHRLGVDGNFPSSGILAGRLQLGGGMHYSEAFGKTCPCDERIYQIHQEIWPRVRALLDGTTTPPEGFLMGLSEDDQKAVLWNVREIKKTLDEDTTLWNVRQIRDQMAMQTAAIEALAKNAGLDPAVVTAAIEKALSDVKFVLTKETPDA